MSDCMQMVECWQAGVDIACNKQVLVPSIPHTACYALLKTTHGSLKESLYSGRPVKRLANIHIIMTPNYNSPCKGKHHSRNKMAPEVDALVRVIQHTCMGTGDVDRSSSALYSSGSLAQF